ncbi:MAG: MBL fold metallo-hydrolase [Deltaproteobacteria bacterium]|nr:MBL fold metallo-hydrolase [Deltaproteobacteria bacterium]
MVETIENGPFAENCYIAMDRESHDALLIDPGSEPKRIGARIEEIQAHVVAIANTHGHIDHVGAVAPLQEKLGVPFLLHPAERPWIDQLPVQASMFGLGSVQIPTIDAPLKAGQELEVGGLKAQVLFTPGHSAGGCCFYFEAQGVVFVGDTLFQRSIGRTDLPGGDHGVLLEAITKNLLSLDDSVVAFCGHGPSTLIGAEREHNPFLAH